MSVKTIPVNEYADRILQGHDRVSSDELQINGDFDYVMLMMLTMEYDRLKSPYRLEFGEGQTAIGRYEIPNMTISRK